MRQLTFRGPGDLAWEMAPDPVISHDHAALVRPLAVARCDLDAPMAGFGIFPGPFAVGHEVVAEVMAVGAAVVDRSVGDRVVVPFQPSCGDCANCRRRRFAACLAYTARAGAAFGFGPAGGDHGGGMSDLLAVPHADHLLAATPPAVPVAALATIPDNVIDGYRAVADGLAQDPGTDVLVVGGDAASISLYAIVAAFALGAGSVRYADSDPTRLQAAADVGADVIEVGDQWPRHFERAGVVVAASLQAEGLAAAVRSTEPYGRLTSVAIHFAPETPLPMLEMYTRGITLHTSRADSRRFLTEVLELVGGGRLDPLAVPTTLLPWDDADTAWMQPAIKLVFVRD